jgi:hypothetical protein
MSSLPSCRVDATKATEDSPVARPAPENIGRGQIGCGVGIEALGWLRKRVFLTDSLPTSAPAFAFRWREPSDNAERRLPSCGT